MFEPQRNRSVLWRWRQGVGLERCRLARDGEDWLLSGTILAESEGRPAEARYTVRCDAAWRTRRAEVRLSAGDAERVLDLVAADGHWLADGHEITGVAGSVDVDLSWTPSTNTLPIRRLGLAVGEASRPLVAAWIRFPALTIEPLPQEYLRLGEHRYRYTSRGGAFTAELEVDADGLVVTYGDFWERMAADPTEVSAGLDSASQ